MDSNTINQVFEAVLDDETLLDGISSDLIDDLRQYLGFYLMDRDPDINELDFN